MQAFTTMLVVSAGHMTDGPCRRVNSQREDDFTLQTHHVVILMPQHPRVAVMSFKQWAISIQWLSLPYCLCTVLHT